MNKSTAQRQKAVNAALGSVEAEGLNPSHAIQRDLLSFATGKSTLEDVRKSTILRITTTTNNAKQTKPILTEYTATDPYLDQTTGILRNKFAIASQQGLDDAESDITPLEITGLTVSEFPLTKNSSFATYKQIHKQLFGAIYDWAGEPRTINIGKGTTRFCESRFIDSEGSRILNELVAENLLQTTSDSDEYIKRLAYYYSELNMLHPFREGNGRTLRTFISILAMNSGGKMLAWDKMDPQENIDACVYAVSHDESKIETMLARIID